MPHKVREINAILKKGKPGDVRVAVAYPSLYEVAVASLSYQMIYYYVNSLDGFVCERFHLHKFQGIEPPALSVERGSPLRDFELVLFSVHYEPDLVNILRLLRAGGVPLRARDRGGKPLVVVGGPPIISNPEPLSAHMDVAILGEIEPTLPFLLERYLEYRGDYKAFLEALPPEKGFYTPPLGRPESVNVSYATTLRKEFHPIAQVQPLDREPVWGRGTRVEVSRGCYRGCAFCLEGRIFNIYRERPLSDIVEIALKGSKLNATKRVVFVSLSFFDHSRAKEILDRLVSEGLKLSVPSLRAETLDEESLELILAGGQRTLTIAPETASRRLAAVLRKSVPYDAVARVAAQAKKLGFKSIKLYFMIGLPGETQEDVRAIVEYVRRLSEASGFKGTREIKVSVSPLIPKPHTLLQCAAMDSLSSLKEKILIIKKGLGGVAEVRAYDPRWACVQAVIARGGGELGAVLEAWAEAGGGLGGWRRAVKLVGLNVGSYLGQLQLDRLPWSFIKLRAKPTILRNRI